MATTAHAPFPEAAPARRVWTPAEVQAFTDEEGRLPDGRRWPRYEVIDGELLVTAAPFAPHGRMVMELAWPLLPYVRAHALGELFNVAADISLNEHSLVQPDILVIPPDQRPALRWDSVKRLLLTVEVISESSERADRVKKRRHYQKHRVGEYWIVDLKARVFEVWHPDDERPAVLDRALVWQPSMDGWAPEVPPLEIDLAALFDRVLGPEPEVTPPPGA